MRNGIGVYTVLGVSGAGLVAARGGPGSESLCGVSVDFGVLNGDLNGFDRALAAFSTLLRFASGVESWSDIAALMFSQVWWSFGSE